MELDIKAMESKWIERWEKIGLYSFKRDERNLFTVDTPPPTVSGEMHIGHSFSYPSQDFTARYKRLRGFNVLYPWGFDDNGLATERYTEKKMDVHGYEMPLEEFRNLVRKVSEEAETEMLRSWKSLGISATFENYYRTISPEVMALSQKLFLSLARSGKAFTSEGPTMWCPTCGTAISQSDLKDMERETDFVRVAFSSGMSEIIIATTRPELMGACVALAANPEDPRYAALIGRTAKVPLYEFEVPIISDNSVNPDKGTGIEMVCTFGDQNDLEIWRRLSLQTRIIINRRGKIEDSGLLNGFGIKAARRAIIEKLEAEGFARGKEKKNQSVNAHERCDTPVEILVSRQWFIGTMAERDSLIERGESVRWFPEHMHTRFNNWVNGMKWDWCISRQRFYGVPFPVWYCNSCGKTILAGDDELPINPVMTTGRKCNHCGSEDVVPERDVMDTWLTSSISTAIVADRWNLPNDVFSVRFQAHDIISTWAYTSIVRAHLNFGRKPWEDIVISGLVYDPSGRKVSKSRGNSLSVGSILERFGADSLRYWASGSITGDDIAVREQDFVRGRRSVIKIYNAAKLIAIMADGTVPEHDVKRVKLPVNQWILGLIGALIPDVTDAMDSYQYSKARSTLDNFFWNTFCDNYLEIAKAQINMARSSGKREEVREIVNVSSFAMLQILRMFSPFLPFISEEAYEMIPVKDRKESLQLDKWPDPADMSEYSPTDFEEFVRLVSMIRAYKSSLKMSPGMPMESLTIRTPFDVSGFVPVLSAMFRIGEVKTVDSDSIQVGE